MAAGLSPFDLLRAAAGDVAPFALVGRWAGGGALVGSDPLVVVEEPDDPFALIDLQPEVVDAPGDAGGGVPGEVRGGAGGAVGGGWIGYLGYGVGSLVEHLPAARCRPVPLPRSQLAFYDHLLRYEEASGRWWFEALWSDRHTRRLRARLERWERRLGQPAPRAGRTASGPSSRCPVPRLTWWPWPEPGSTSARATCSR